MLPLETQKYLEIVRSHRRAGCRESGMSGSEGGSCKSAFDQVRIPANTGNSVATYPTCRVLDHLNDLGLFFSFYAEHGTRKRTFHKGHVTRESVCSAYVPFAAAHAQNDQL